MHCLENLTDVRYINWYTFLFTDCTLIGHNNDINIFYNFHHRDIVIKQ